MQLIIFIGIQASGKSFFYKERFIDSHIRLNLDMLKTRHRESILFNACLQSKANIVIDNTNPLKSDRFHYIELAKKARYQIFGYYFSSDLNNAVKRNELRNGKKVVPVRAILGTYKKLELPSYSEGFDKLYYVSIDKHNSFKIEEWKDEI